MQRIFICVVRCIWMWRLKITNIHKLCDAKPSSRQREQIVIYSECCCRAGLRWETSPYAGMVLIAGLVDQLSNEKVIRKVKLRKKNQPFMCKDSYYLCCVVQWGEVHRTINFNFNQLLSNLDKTQFFCGGTTIHTDSAAGCCQPKDDKGSDSHV